MWRENKNTKGAPRFITQDRLVDASAINQETRKRVAFSKVRLLQSSAFDSFMCIFLT